MARLAYGDSLAAEDRREGHIPVFGSNGPVGTHDQANTGSPVLVVGRKGSYGKVQYSHLPVFCIDTTYYIDGSTTASDIRWLYYALSTLKLDSMSQDVGVPGLSRDAAYSECVPLPRLAAQRAIADYLDTETERIDALIAKKQRMVELVSEYFEALLVTTMGSLPSRRRLRQLAKLGTGHTPDRKKPEYWFDCTIPWVTAADLSSRDDAFDPLIDTEQKVSEIGVENSAAVVHPQGTVMLCRTASIGLLCEIGVPMATTQAFVTWTPGPDLDSTFLLFALSSMAQEWKRLAFGSTHDTIYMPDLESVKIPFADLDEQKRIAARLKDASTRIRKIRKKLNDQIGLLLEHRQGLITAAVTGQKEIPGVAA